MTPQQISDHNQAFARTFNNQMVADVYEFHKTFGHPVLPYPRIPTLDRQQLRRKLIMDEAVEFDEAHATCENAFTDGHEMDPAALAEFADAIADMIYFYIGTALEYGIPLHLVWNEVQRANMTKLWTEKEVNTDGMSMNFLECGWTKKPVGDLYVVYDQTGKVKKPPSWKEPDIRGIIERTQKAAKMVGTEVPREEVAKKLGYKSIEEMDAAQEANRSKWNDAVAADAAKHNSDAEVESGVKVSNDIPGYMNP